MKNVHLIFIFFLFLFASGLFVAAAPAKVEHAVVLHDIYISPESLSCKQDFLALVDVQNKGDFVEDIHVELVSQALDIDVFSAPLLLQAGTRQQVILPVRTAAEPQGSFTFEARLYTDQGIKQGFQSFTFRGCVTVSPHIPLPEASPSFFAPVPRPPTKLSAEHRVDGRVVVTLGLLVLLFLTALLAVARLFSG